MKGYYISFDLQADSFSLTPSSGSSKEPVLAASLPLQEIPLQLSWLGDIINNIRESADYLLFSGGLMMTLSGIYLMFYAFNLINPPESEYNYHTF